jgi:N4-gp56 family major capsid protein
MANAYTDTSGGSLGTSLVQTAYDRYVEFALRAMPLLRSIADKRPEQQAMPGSSVVFQLYADLAAATSTLTETTDPDSVAIPNTTNVTVTLNEYGNPVLVTRKLRLFALSDVDPAIADIVAFNMADSLESLVATTLTGGSNFLRRAAGNLGGTYNGANFIAAAGATTTMVSTDTITSPMIRATVAKMRANKVMPRKGNLFWCGIDPEVSIDLRAETGAAAWRDPHVYSAPEQIWAGEIGQYEGCFFVESPRLPDALDSGAGGNTVRRFMTLVAGRQALAEAVAEEPHVVVGNVTDKLMRFRPISWYGVLGWAVYRQLALVRLETTSSIHNAN